MMLTHIYYLRDLPEELEPPGLLPREAGLLGREFAYDEEVSTISKGVLQDRTKTDLGDKNATLPSLVGHFSAYGLQGGRGIDCRRRVVCPCGWRGGGGRGGARRGGGAGGRGGQE